MAGDDKTTVPMDETECLAALRGPYPPGPARHVLLAAADQIERQRRDNNRMVEALSEIANRSSVDRGAQWAANRAREGLRDA